MKLTQKLSVYGLFITLIYNIKAFTKSYGVLLMKWYHKFVELVHCRLILKQTDWLMPLRAGGGLRFKTYVQEKKYESWKNVLFYSLRFILNFLEQSQVSSKIHTLTQTTLTPAVLFHHIILRKNNIFAVIYELTLAV